MARNLKKKKEKGYTVKQMKKMGFPDYFSKPLKRKNLTRMARNLKKKKEKGYTVKQMKDMGFPDYFYKKNKILRGGMEGPAPAPMAPEPMALGLEDPLTKLKNLVYELEEINDMASDELSESLDRSTKDPMNLYKDIHFQLTECGKQQLSETQRSELKSIGEQVVPKLKTLVTNVQKATKKRKEQKPKKVKPNEQCPCGSKNKYKKCCGKA